jgi:hypothetical protein
MFTGPSSFLYNWLRAFVPQLSLPLLLVFFAGNVEADPCGSLPPPNVPGFQALLQTFLDSGCHKTWVHDPRVRTTNGVHPNVKVYFSPAMWTWMTTNNRVGDVPDGSIVIKEQYGFTPPYVTANEWTVMVRDSTSAADGWFWADLVPGGTGDADVTADLCDEPAYPASGYGQYCINCHGSAANNQNTYATDEYLKILTHAPVPGAGQPDDPNDDIHYRLSHIRRKRSAAVSSRCMVPESSDHVVAPSKQASVHRFVTSDQCAGCHNATGTITPSSADRPSMLFYDPVQPNGKPHTVNLSASGEWRFSLMGLAGRDPIFFSQLNSESTLHDNLTDHPGQAKEFVQDLCLRCHGVMGQRQFHLDNQGPFFTRDLLKGLSDYGALGREGISCAVCHRIAATGLGTSATYTGLFNINDGSQINGPFDDVSKLPMQNAVNMEPVQGAQITSSELCGTCHTIFLPVYRANGQPVIDSNTGKQRTFIEQATFFEWQNSIFRDGGPQAQSCQECHMANTFLQNGVAQPLSFKIANIEDNTFPPLSFRAPDADITVKKRDGYRRHLLLGINLFALEMFKQFRNELGLYESDPMLRPSLNTDKGIDTAIDTSANMIAKQRTADVKIESAASANSQLTIDVRVTNKAGHSFPSGVGFRRAFLNLQVLNSGGQVVWASGSVAPNSASQPLKGLIVDGSGQPLVTETFTPTQQTTQPHFWSANPITRQDQVQIYEELVRNPEGFLSTSFIALNEKAKDNRLQPQGWSSSGANATETGPVGVCLPGTNQCDPQYSDGSGSNVVRYIVPVASLDGQPFTIRATLYYQAIPPYYQLQRATDATGDDTQRLQDFVQNLAVEGTSIPNWALPITSDQVTVQASSTAVPLAARIHIVGPNTKHRSGS